MNPSPTIDPEAVKYLGIRKVEDRYDVDRSTIWRQIKAGKFPAPVYLADRRVWRLDVLEEWERREQARPAGDRRGAKNLGGSEPA